MTLLGGAEAAIRVLLVRYAGAVGHRRSGPAQSRWPSGINERAIEESSAS